MNVTVVLEVGNSWLKTVIVRSGYGTTYVKALSLERLSEATDETIAKKVADFLKTQKVGRAQTAIVSFSRNAVTLRNLRIPSANPSEIDDMIKLHVGRQVPYAKEEIINGYRVVGKDTMGYSKVMLAIVHRESVRRIFRILERAGLYTDRLELSSDGVLSWLCLALRGRNAKPPESFIILDIDSGFTDFIISGQENILFSRVITQGREQLMEEAKWPKFLGEMKQTLVISQGEEIVTKPSRIYLTGAAEGLDKLAATIETEFNMPVERGATLAGLPLAKEVALEPAGLLEEASFTALLGLGLDATKKKINFVLPEAQIRKALREKTRDAIVLGSSAMYLILMLCGIYLERMHGQEARLALITERYASMKKGVELLDEKLERIRQIKSKRDTRTLALNYLLEVSRLLSGDILVTSIGFERNDRVTIKGRAAQMSDIFGFITRLENSPYFKDVQTRYTTRRQFKGEDLNEFELICPVEQTDKKQAAAGKKAPKARED
ncbi:MAG: PilN domain-containing protein [Deltaproteobacteria bacterium]